MARRVRAQAILARRLAPMPPGGGARLVHSCASPRVLRRALARGLGVAAACALTLAASGPAAAGPPARGGRRGAEGPDRDDRPFGRGTVLPSFGLGGWFNRYAGSLSFGGGAIYFPVGGVGTGLVFDNSIMFWGRQIKRDLPGIEKQTATYSARLTPTVMFVPFRRGRTIPYIRGGVGPMFHNNGGPTVGHWRAGLGVWFPLGRVAFASVGIDVGAAFPYDRCRRAYRYEGEDEIGPFYTYVGGRGFGSPCGLFVAPHISLAFGIPTGRRARERREQRERERDSGPTQGGAGAGGAGGGGGGETDYYERPAAQPGFEEPSAPPATPPEPAPAPDPAADPADRPERPDGSEEPPAAAEEEPPLQRPHGGG